MSRTVYVNGQYLPEEAAKVSVFDRGFLFADAVYEVTAVVNGRLAEYDGHMARLARSCRELNLRLPVSIEALREIHLALIEKTNFRKVASTCNLAGAAPVIATLRFPPTPNRR